jgi:hypothetical protein
MEISAEKEIVEMLVRTSRGAECLQGTWRGKKKCELEDRSVEITQTEPQSIPEL